MKTYLAKSDGTTLYEHSLKVRDEALKACKILGLTDPDLIGLVEITAILHDIGKTANSFQKYIKNQTDKENEYIYHNALGYYLIKKFLNANDSSWSLMKEIISSAICFHHDPKLTNLWKTSKVDLEKVFDNEEQLDEVLETMDELKNMTSIGKFFTVCKPKEFYFDEETVSIPNSLSLFNGSTPDSPSVISRIIGFFTTVHNIVRWSDLTVSSGEEVLDNLIPMEAKGMIMPSTFDAERWGQQMNMADMASKNCLSLLDATMGYGKTCVGVKYIEIIGKKAYWVLPNNSLAHSTYNEVLNLVNICGMKMSVGLLLTGKFIYGDKNSDIIITNIDNFTSGDFKNSWKELAKDRLFRTCIFDEFHKYFQDSPLISVFSGTMYMRSCLSSMNTLLLSGTPIIEGLLPRNVINCINNNVSIPSPDSDLKHKKIMMHYLDEKEYESLNDGTLMRNTLSIFASVKRSQKKFKEMGYDKNIHARKDGTGISNDLTWLKKNKGKGCNCDASIASTNMLVEGHDCSCGDKLVYYNPTPEGILQAGGRINRYDSNIIGHYYVVSSNLSDDTNIYESTGEVGGQYKKFVLDFADFLKKVIPDGKLVELSELFDARKAYYKENESKFKKQIAGGFIKNGFEQLCQIAFKEGIDPENNTNEEMHVTDKMTLRGNTRTIFIQMKKDDGSFTDTFAASEIWFGEGAFNKNLACAEKTREIMADIVRNMYEYIKKNQDLKKKYLGNSKEMTKIGTIFDTFITKARCSETPIIIGVGNKPEYGYNDEIGFYKKKDEK